MRFLDGVILIMALGTVAVNGVFLAVIFVIQLLTGKLVIISEPNLPLLVIELALLVIGMFAALFCISRNFSAAEKL